VKSPLSFAPDPERALDVLAFVLCPASLFVPSGDVAMLDQVNEALRPAKREAIRRWAASRPGSRRV
jgi:hypothetical protein